MILVSCKTISEKIKNDRCLTDKPITVKKDQNFDAFSDKSIKEIRKQDTEYCCPCMDMNPVCQKPTLIKYCKEINK